MRFGGLINLTSLLALLFLCACSNSPSTSDVERALLENFRQEVQSQIDAMTAITGNREHAKNMVASMGMPTDPESIKIHDVSMGKMTKSENGTYSGQVDFSFTTGKGRGKRTINRSVHAALSRESGRWRVVGLRGL